MNIWAAFAKPAQTEVGGGSLPDAQAGSPVGAPEPACSKLPTPDDYPYSIAFGEAAGRRLRSVTTGIGQPLGPRVTAPIDGLLPTHEVPVDDGPSVQDVLALLPFGYLSGAAGTGKTWLARQVVASLPPGQAILAATTGIAAINLGDATTINALLSYFDTASLIDNYARGFLGARLRQLRKSGVRVIVLDEVSMLDADQLTVLVQALEEIDRTREYDSELEEVVEHYDDDRRLKLLLVGDFAQLPPVKAAFAFESPEWTRFESHTLKLTVIRRQAEEAYIHALLAVRQGHPEMALEIMEPRMVPQLDIQFEGTTIVAKNDAVDRINNLRHAKLTGALQSWATIRAGEQQNDWTKQIPNAVELKVGALVMILANLPSPKIDETDVLRTFQYVNGDLATVIAKVDAGMRVVLHRTGEEVTVKPNVKEWREPTGKRKPPYTVKGSVTYMPLRLAYATTVHKCVSGNTRIPLHGIGYREISEVQIGNVTPYGTIRGVARTEQRAYRVQTERGYSVVASADHRWVTREGLVPTRDLTDQHALKLNAGPSFPGWDSMDPEAWWWLGMTVGDGCYTDRTGGQIHFACAFAVLGDLYAEVGERQWGPRIRWRKDRRGLYLTSLSLRRRLEALGLDYVKAPVKRIPHAVWLQGPERRAAFLRGLFDADGSCGRNRVALTAAAEWMSADVQEMLLTLGIVSKRTSYGSVYKEQPYRYWQVWIGAESLDDYRRLIGFSHPHKLLKLAQTRPNRTLNPTLTFDQVLHVEPLELTIPMYDVEIDAPHLLTFGPFLGHNSQGLTLDAVQVSLSDHFMGNPGSLYVALSRARSLEGLRIVGNARQFVARCGVDQKVRGYL